MDEKQLVARVEKILKRTIGVNERKDICISELCDEVIHWKVEYLEFYNQAEKLSKENERLTAILDKVKEMVPKGGSKHGRPDYMTMIPNDKVKEFYDLLEENQ